MTSVNATAAWWRPEPRARALEGSGSDSRVAFGALVAFTGILVLSPQVWFPVLRPLRIAFIAGVVAIAAHFLNRSVQRRAAEPLQPEMAIAFALVGWAALTLPLSYWPGGSLAELLDIFVKAVAFFWLIGTLVTTTVRLRRFVWALVLTTIPLAVTALKNYQTGVFLVTPVPTVQRIAGYNIDGGSGLTANPNDLALLLNLVLPFAMALVATARGLPLRLLALGSVLLSIAGVVVTFSRAGFLGLATIFVSSLLLFGRRQPLVALAAIVVVVAALPTMLPEGYLDRLNTITNIEADRTGSAQGRWGDLTVAANAVMHNPVTGVGLGQNILALNALRGETWRVVHNVYLQYAVDLGIPGLLLFLWLFVAVFRAANRVRRRARADRTLREVGFMADAALIALSTFAVAAFFYPVAYQFFFFCIAGLALAVRNAFRDRIRLTSRSPVPA
jgi:O-antigen ligase